MRPFDYKLIHALDVVIKEHSFEKAAEQLNISQSAVSQRIKTLEEQMAQPVLIRVQPPQPTRIGEMLLRHFRQVRQLEYDLVDQVKPTNQHTTVPISIAVNADTLASWFIPSLTPLLKSYPIELNLQVCDETKTKELLKRGEVYAALSNQSESFTGCKVELIGDIDYILCATPEFHQQYFEEGLNAHTLRFAPCVEFDQHDTMHKDYIADHFGIHQGDYPCHTVRSSEAFVTMALAGVAYCLLPQNQANAYLKQGQLLDLQPEKHLQRTLYWHSWVLEKGLHKKVSQCVVNYGKALLADINK